MYDKAANAVFMRVEWLFKLALVVNGVRVKYGWEHINRLPKTQRNGT